MPRLAPVMSATGEVELELAISIAFGSRERTGQVGLVIIPGASHRLKIIASTGRNRFLAIYKHVRTGAWNYHHRSYCCKGNKLCDKRKHGPVPSALVGSGTALSRLPKYSWPEDAFARLTCSTRTLTEAARGWSVFRACLSV